MGVGKQAVKGVIFVTLSNNIIFLLSFLANNIILARLLPVEAFGIFSLATFFVNLFSRIKELGFDYAVIHSKESVTKIANVYITLQIILSLLISVISIPASVIVMWVYGWEVGAATMVLGISSIFMNLFNTLNALYDKELKFKLSTIITVISTVISLLGMVVMGYLGFGLWSLVLGGIPGSIIGMILLFRYLPITYQWDADKKITKWFLDFGPWWYWALAATASLIVMQYDNFIVYTLGGAFIAGSYVRAYSWATMPTSRITAIISKVAFPVYAKLQEDKERLSKAYSLTLSTIVMLTFPLGFLSVLIIREAVVLLIGEKWLTMVPLFQMLLGYMLLRPIFDDSGALLVAIGKSKAFNTVQLIQAALMLILTTFFVYMFGGFGAPIGVAIVMAVGVAYQYINIRDSVTISLARIFIAPIVACVLAFSITYVLKKTSLASYDPITILLATCILFMIIYTITILALRGKEIRMQVMEFKDLVKS